MSPADGRPTSPTLEEVAVRAGVSRSTVSRVINDSPRVSPAARAAVQRAVADLGYVPNPAARSLATRRSGSIALVVREPGERVFDEPFFGAIVHALGAALADTDLQLVLLLSDPEGDPRRLERFLLGGHADGALLLSLHEADPLPADLVEAGLPAVIGGRPVRGAPQVAHVDADNVGGARRATEHLLARGRRRLAVLTGPLDMPAAEDRLDGSRQAVAASGRDPDEVVVVEGGFDHAGGRRAAEQLLARVPDVDAIVAASDLAAVGAMQALAAAGRRVPDDVAVTGFDDSLVARTATPALTSVRQPIDRLGAEMVRLLLAQIGGEPDADRARVLLPTELVIRDST